MQGSKEGRGAEQGQGRKATVEASIVQVMREMVDAGGVAYTTGIARQLGKDPGNVNRVLRSLLERGRVVKGEKEGRIVPYYLREMAPR